MVIRIVAPIVMVRTKNRIPFWNEPVHVLTVPSTTGPKNPPRLPTELIRPMLPAAAASAKNRLGIDQNAGKYAFRPVAARTNRATVSHIDDRAQTAASNATAPR